MIFGMCTLRASVHSQYLHCSWTDGIQILNPASYNNDKSKITLQLINNGNNGNVSALTANISTDHERILLKFKILLRYTNDKL